MTKAELIAMIKEINSQENAETMKTLVKSVLDEYVKTGGKYDGAIIGVDGGAVKEFDYVKEMQRLGIGSTVFGDGMILTDKGSIIDRKNPRQTWRQLSEPMTKFAEAFREYIKSKGQTVPKTLEEGSDPSGGYLVPEEFQAAIVQYDTEPAVVWPRATIWPMLRDKLGMPKLKQRPDEDDTTNFDHFAGVSFTWTDEGGEKTETEPEFEFIELIAHELSGYTEVTDILLEDSAINLMNFLTNLFRRAYVWVTDRSFIRGTGARQPLGVVSDPAVTIVARATAGAFTYTDAINMSNQLPSVFDSGAVWLMNKRVLNSIRNERDNNNALLLQQFYQAGPPGIGHGPIMSILGYPVIPADGKTYALGTTGDVILGNWEWYYIGDRKRFTLDVSKHYKFRNNKTALRVCGRLDGQPAVSEAFVILGLPGGGS